MNTLALKGHTNSSHGFQPMEPAYQQQLRTLKGSTNRGIVIGRPLQGRSRKLGECSFPRVENPWLFKVSPFGARTGQASREERGTPTGLSSADCYGVQPKDVGHAQGSCLGMRVLRALPGLTLKTRLNLGPLRKGRGEGIYESHYYSDFF
jgi:hypothetical protein